MASVALLQQLPFYFEIEVMIEMIKRFEVIRLVDLAWRPRGALIMTHDTEKKHPYGGKYRLLCNNKKIMLFKKNIYIL